MDRLSTGAIAEDYVPQPEGRANFTRGREVAGRSPCIFDLPLYDRGVSPLCVAVDISEGRHDEDDNFSFKSARSARHRDCFI